MNAPIRFPLRLAFALAISSLLIPLGSASAGMVLTAAGNAAGFSLTTFASGFPNSPAGQGQNGGPFGIAFANNGNVLVSDLDGKIYVFPSDADGQTVSGATVVATYSNSDPLGMTQNGSQIYLGFQSSNKIDLVNSNGAALQTLPLHNAGGSQITIAGPHGLAITADGHLLVSSDTGNNSTGQGIFDIDPTTGLTKQIVSTNSFDGITVSKDGTIVYGARADGEVVGFNTSTGAQVFDAGNINGADGLTLGSGVLAGNLYVNTNYGQLIQVNLSNKVSTVIGTGGSRGDFVSVDPTNGSLLLDQTDSILRLAAPAGGGFGSSTVPEPASITLYSVGLASMIVYGWRRKRALVPLS